MLQALAANLKPQGVEVVLVSVDEPKDEAKAQSFLKDNGITLKSYIVEGSIADFKAGINPELARHVAGVVLVRSARRAGSLLGRRSLRERDSCRWSKASWRASPSKPRPRYGLAPGKVDRVTSRAERAPALQIRNDDIHGFSA